MERRHIFTIAIIAAVLLAGWILLIADWSNAAERKIPIYCVELPAQEQGQGAAQSTPQGAQSSQQGTDQSIQQPKVAISFDAAWGNEHTKAILDILKENNANATFFLVKFWAETYPEDVAMIAKSGCEIGNHSATHPDMTGLSADQIRTELTETAEAIKKVTGVQTTLFRPPFGAYNNTLMETCEECGYQVIQWSVDSLDWKDISAEQITARILEKAEAGSIILCHNNAQYVEDYLPPVLKGLQEKGLQVVAVGDMIYKDNYHVDDQGKQISDAKKAKKTAGGN